MTERQIQVEYSYEVRCLSNILLGDRRVWLPTFLSRLNRPKAYVHKSTQLLRDTYTDGFSIIRVCSTHNYQSISRQHAAVLIVADSGQWLQLQKANARTKKVRRALPLQLSWTAPLVLEGPKLRSLARTCLVHPVLVANWTR